MSNEYHDQYESANKALIYKEMRDKERREAKALAMKKNIAKGLAAALRNERIRQSIAKDALDATERSRYGMIDPRLKRVARVGGEMHFGYDDPDDVITGDEPLPWDTDPDDQWEE